VPFIIISYLILFFSSETNTSSSVVFQGEDATEVLFFNTLALLSFAP
jgi:hypothetical protein